MSATVQNPGLLSLLVDNGRFGNRAFGVGPSGPLDSFAYEVGNYLAGNEQMMPAIEFFHPGPEITFHEPTLISVTGVGVAIQLDDREVLPWRPIAVAKNTTLRLLPTGQGSCGYIHILGGWKAESWRGSRTTSLSMGLGGYQGRALKKGDDLDFIPTEISKNNQQPNWHVSGSELGEVYSDQKHICCVPGPESGCFEKNQLEQFVSQRFQIMPNSNRMGFRLFGEALSVEKKIEMVSSAVDFGTIQVLPDGQLIVLMADHQTTGGYPRLASVVSADLPRLAQLGKQRDLYFSWSTAEMAYALLTERIRRMKELKNSCLLRLKPYLH